MRLITAGLRKTFLSVCGYINSNIALAGLALGECITYPFLISKYLYKDSLGTGFLLVSRAGYVVI
jgi:hypothetical protein